MQIFNWNSTCISIAYLTEQSTEMFLNIQLDFPITWCGCHNNWIVSKMKKKKSIYLTIDYFEMLNSMYVWLSGNENSRNKWTVPTLKYTL